MTGRVFLGVYLALFAGLLALVLVFNFDETASFTWWPGHRLEQVPLVYLVFGGVVLGAFYASLVAILEQARSRLTIRRLQSRLGRQEKPAAPPRESEPQVMDQAAGPESGDESWSH